MSDKMEMSDKKKETLMGFYVVVTTFYLNDIINYYYLSYNYIYIYNYNYIYI